MRAEWCPCLRFRPTLASCPLLPSLQFHGDSLRIAALFYLCYNVRTTITVETLSPLVDAHPAATVMTNAHDT